MQWYSGWPASGGRTGAAPAPWREQRQIDILATASVGFVGSAPPAETLETLSVPAAKINPVIIIPGIMGSWNVNPWFLDWHLDPILGTYENLIDQLVWAGYEEGTSLIRFPYDWRKDNAYTGVLLGTRLGEVRREVDGHPYIDGSKIDIVAHSMGGLVARSYIEGSSYAADLGRLVTLGTPHRGAPKAYLIGEGADHEAAGDAAYLLLSLMASKAGYGYRAPHGRIAGERHMVEYIHDHVPTVGQLYPSSDYEPDYLIGEDGRHFPFGRPPNPFLDDLNANVGRLVDRLGEHRILAIVGRAEDSTYGSFAVKEAGPDPMWRYGRVPQEYRTRGVGDHTVPIQSADLNLLDSRIDSLVSGVGDVGMIEHQKLPTDFQREILKFLSGSESPVVMKINRRRRGNSALDLRSCSVSAPWICW